MDSSGPKKGRNLKEVLRSVSLLDSTLDAIEEQVRNREASLARAPKLFDIDT
jgi:hypothetical protein